MPKRKFNEIYSDLKNKIETQEYPFNSLIPIEFELIKMYDCSRNTIRRAINVLIEKGYVQVRQGQRVRVIYEPVERNVFKIGGIESFKEAAIRNGFSYATKVVKLEEIVADEEIAQSSIYDYLENFLKMKKAQNDYRACNFRRQRIFGA